MSPPPTAPLSVVALLALAAPLAAQEPPATDPRIPTIVQAVSAERIEADIRRLVGFGTRHTLSDTLSSTRGIGAARRWIKAEFDRISAGCGGCLRVFYVEEVFRDLPRVPVPTNVVNVLAVQRGTTDPGRFIIMAGDIDSRISDILNHADSNPGANDNASGVAGVLEAARVLSRQRFNGSIVYAALSGEEQGLLGGQTVARMARDSGWRITGVLNNDMIGNTSGIDGISEDSTARVFSEGTPPTESDTARRRRRFTGGEVDGNSRQLARYVDRIADRYVPNLDVWLVYRLDRFGRGGHHRPFADLGFPAVRIMETHEHYDRQHQDIRIENGRAYGDVLEGVNFKYAAKLTALNASVLAALAAAPGPPEDVRISGAVAPAARLRWRAPADSANVAGYRVYWRRTDSPTWDHSAWVGQARDHTFTGLVIDNWFFGVASVGRDGNESVVVFPSAGGT